MSQDSPTVNSSNAINYLAAQVWLDQIFADMTFSKLSGGTGDDFSFYTSI